MSATIETRTLPVLVCSGTPRERGRQQGEVFRSMIEQVVDRWKHAIGDRYGISADDYIAEFLTATSFVPAIERFTPGLLEEVRGLAEGSRQSFETMFAYNLMDEEWYFGSERLEAQPGCTVACLVTDAAPPVVAQTMDIPSLHDGTQVVVHHKPAVGPEALIFTGAGMIALNGANGAGIGVVVNNLSMLPSSRSGLPVMFIIRGILEQTTLKDAVEFCERVPHAIGQHYAIGAPDGIAGLEGAANGVMHTDVSTGRYVHANHPLVNTKVTGDSESHYQATRTFIRHERAVELIQDANDQSAIEAILMDDVAPISCSRKAGFMTFGGTSITCSVPPVVHIAPGPPHETPWLTIAFDS